MRLCAAWPSMALTIAFTGVAAFALAQDEKAACVSAADAAQQLRSDGKLRDARAALLVCAREACPGIVRADCAQWLSEVEAAIPTLVVRAQDTHGRELGDVRVLLDETALSSTLDGLPIAVDPGEHTLVCERAGSKQYREVIVLHTGEKNHVVSATLQDVDAAVPPGALTPPRPARSTWRTTTAAGLAGLGVVALGTFAYFGISGRSDVAHLRSSCAGHCAPDEVDAARNKLILADVSLGLSVAASAAAAWLFFGAPALPKSTAPSARSLAVGPVAGGVAAVWVERF